MGCMISAVFLGVLAHIIVIGVLLYRHHMHSDIGWVIFAWYSLMTLGGAGVMVTKAMED